jgi:hypothetical protein
MIHRGLVCLLLGALAWGQAATPKSAAPPQKPAAQPAAPPSAPQEAKAPEAAKVPPDAPVITIDGLCDNPPADQTKASDCKTVVTRAEFEKLVDAIAPTMAPPARRQLAGRYANALVMAHKAHEMGLDQGPKFEEQLKLVRLQVMAQSLNQALQEKASQVPDKDIEDYYQKNTVAYEEATMQRLFIPKSKQLETPKEKLSEAETQKRQQQAEAAMKTEADALRARAAKGEDFAKLQEEAFQFAGMKSKPPSSSMGKTRRTSLPPGHASVMDLKPGEVSQVIADQSGSFVYKIGEKDTLPLDKVREEIHGTLRAQRMQDSMQSLQQAATPTLNEDYFMVPPGPAPPGMSMPMGGAKPNPKPLTSEPK